MRNVVQMFLAANTILLMCKWNHSCFLLVYVISVITPGKQPALTAFWRYYLLKNILSDRMIKQLLNSVITKCRDLSVSRRSIICLSLWLWQIIDLLATEKSRYFAQPRPIIANYAYMFQKIGQGKALAVPSGAWWDFFCWHKSYAEQPGFQRLRALDSLQFISEHSLVGTLHQTLATMVQLVCYYFWGCTRDCVSLV